MVTSREKHLLGDILLLIVAIIWGMGFIAVKIGLEDGMAPFFLMFLRFFVAGLALLPLMVIRIRKVGLSQFKAALKDGILLGLFMFVGFAFQTFGLQYTTTSNNAFLTGVNVVMVPFITYFLTKKKLKIQSVFATFITLIGIGVLTQGTDIKMNLGDILTLVCALMFAFHISITSLVADKHSSKDLVFIQMMTASILSLLATFFFKESHDLTLNSSLAILYLGIFSTMLAFVLQTVGQRYAHATGAAMILSTESLFGPVFAILLLGDPLNLRIILGGLIIFVAITLSEVDLSLLKKQERSTP